jgi:hypothetical protein
MSQFHTNKEKTLMTYVVWRVPTFTLMSISSSNSPQNSETNFCEKNEVDKMKIIIILIAYTLNNFPNHMKISY